jgi:transcriptional regulator with XRE-family HTH domain
VTAPPEPPPARRQSPTGEQLGRVIRRLRVEREMNLQALAAASGLHWTYLSGIERGHRNPSLQVVAAIAASFGLTTAELVREAERPGPSG